MDSGGPASALRNGSYFPMPHLRRIRSQALRVSTALPPAWLKLQDVRAHHTMARRSHLPRIMSAAQPGFVSVAA